MEEWREATIAFRRQRPALVPNNIGVGTLAWGNRERGYGIRFHRADLQQVFDTLVDGGVSFFDTSHAFGAGMRDGGQCAEQLLGECAAHYHGRGTPAFGTTYAPGGLFGGNQRSVASALDASCDRLGLASVDLFQVPARRSFDWPIGLPFGWPFGGKSSAALLGGAALAHQRGLCSAVGVRGVRGGKAVLAAHAALAAEGVELASVGADLSLLDQSALADGTLAACRQLGVPLLASAPLARGLASGRFTAMNPTGGRDDESSRASRGPRGGAGRFGFDELRRALPLHASLDRVARAVTRREKRPVTPAQVAINWVVAKGAAPLPGVCTLADAHEVLGCVGWALDDGDVAALDRAAAKAKASGRIDFDSPF